MKKYTVTFQIEAHDVLTNVQGSGIEDLLVTAVLPALDLTLVPLTLTLKKVRG